MKIIKIHSIIILFSVLLMNCGGTQKRANTPIDTEHMKLHTTADPTETPALIEVSDTPNAPTDSVLMRSINTYLTLKDALVLDDQVGAAQASSLFIAALQVLDTTHVSPENKQTFQSTLQIIQEYSEKISSSDLATQRSHFEALSQHMIELIEMTGTPKKLYQQYCPMYNQNAGGSWLSDSENIRNPLFGSEMLACGRIQKEIK